jgi:hypothetical protein
MDTLPLATHNPKDYGLLEELEIVTTAAWLVTMIDQTL